MDDIEILNRIRELRDRCEDLVVRLCAQNLYQPVTMRLLDDAWKALGQASMEFQVEKDHATDTQTKSGENHG